MEQSGQQPEQSQQSPPPPRAFTQGVGTVFQFTGGILFIVMSLACCGSGLLGKETWKREDLMRVGWHLPGDGADQPSYSALRATSVSLIGGIGLALAVAGLGLGLQATRRSAGSVAVGVTLLGLVFWAVHAFFFVQVMRAWMLGAIAFLLVLVYGVFFALAIGAWREMQRNPPPAGHEILPEGHKVP